MVKYLKNILNELNITEEIRQITGLIYDFMLIFYFIPNIYINKIFYY